MIFLLHVQWHEATLHTAIIMAKDRVSSLKNLFVISRNVFITYTSVFFVTFFTLLTFLIFTVNVFYNYAII